jgi:competence ComEA-like helix-hairpin-helix protein
MVKATLRCIKTHPTPLTLLFLALSLALSGCARRSFTTNEHQARTFRREANEQQSIASSANTSNQNKAALINLNTGSANELETLPGIGKGLAARIVEHREKFGPFRRVEHLIIVRGISDRRFRALRDLVTVD